MKRLLNFILCSLLVVSLTGVIAINYIGKTAQKAIIQMKLEKEDIESHVETSISVIEHIVPVEYQEVVKTMLPAILEKPEMEAMTSQYGTGIINDITKGTSDMGSYLQADVENMMNRYHDEIKEAMGDSYTDAQKETMMQEVVTRISYETVYDNTVQEVRGQLSDEQLRMIQSANSVIQRSRNQFVLAGMLAVVSTIAIIFLNLHAFKGLRNLAIVGFIVAGVGVAVSASMQFVIPKILGKVPFHINPDIFAVSDLWMMTGGVAFGAGLLMLAYNLLKPKYTGGGI